MRRDSDSVLSHCNFICIRAINQFGDRGTGWSLSLSDSQSHSNEVHIGAIPKL